MRLGEFARSAGRTAKAPATTLALLVSPQIAWAQAAATSAADRLAVAPGGYVPMKPTTGIGMPVPGGIGLQTQFSPLGHYARWLHDGPLMWLSVIISGLVLGLLLLVVGHCYFIKSSSVSHVLLVNLLGTATVAARVSVARVTKNAVCKSI